MYVARMGEIFGFDVKTQGAGGGRDLRLGVFFLCVLGGVQTSFVSKEKPFGKDNPVPVDFFFRL